MSACFHTSVIIVCADGMHEMAVIPVLQTEKSGNACLTLHYELEREIGLTASQPMEPGSSGLGDSQIVFQFRRLYLDLS